MRQVTILGGGIAGLAVAIGFARQGHQVQLFEQASEFREFGAGLQISPNGAVVLQALGLADALAAISVTAQAVQLIDGISGKNVTRLEVARLRPDQGWHFVHRADLIAILQKAAVAAGVALHLGRRALAVDLSGQKPVVTFADATSVAADLLIGADGLHSITRAALNGEAAPFFTKQVAWRALIPCEADAAYEAQIHMGPGRHVVSYPLRGGRLRNLVMVQERASWTAEGWNHLGDIGELRATFADFGPPVQKWLAAVEKPMVWGLFRHPLAQHWGRALPQGGVALLGDGAHPTLPFLAQGANMALEDAWVLTQCLATQDFSQGIENYQNMRATRCAKIVDAASKNARAYHLGTPLRQIAHHVLRLGGMIAPKAALARFNWIYDFDVTRTKG